MDNNNYLHGNRFKIPQANKDFDNPYDLASSELQDLFQRGLEPFKVIDLGSLSVQSGGATSPTEGAWIEYKIPGNHLVLFGYDDTTTNDSVITNAFAEVIYGPNAPKNDDNGFPLKHNRGISGPYVSFFIRWPAQTTNNIAAKIVCYRYKHRPWIGGESAT